MVRDRKNPYAPSSTDGKDGSYERPPGKFALTDALGSSGKSAVAPKAKPAAAGGGDKPENPDDQNDAPEMESQDVEAKEVKEAAPAQQAAPKAQAPPPASASVAPAQKLPRLDLGLRGEKT